MNLFIFSNYTYQFTLTTSIGVDADAAHRPATADDLNIKLTKKQT